MNFLLIIGGLILLILGGNWLLKSAVALSLKLDISKVVIGMTVVSFATSAPELIVSIQAALSGFSDIALGNVIGSNIANIGLVLGITAIITPLVVDHHFYKNWIVMMLLSIAVYFILASGREISRHEGFALISILIIYLYLYEYFVIDIRSLRICHQKKRKHKNNNDDDRLASHPTKINADLCLIFL